MLLLLRTALYLLVSRQSSVPGTRASAHVYGWTANRISLPMQRTIPSNRPYSTSKITTVMNVIAQMIPSVLSSCQNLLNSTTFISMPFRATTIMLARTHCSDKDDSCYPSTPRDIVRYISAFIGQSLSFKGSVADVVSMYSIVQKSKPITRSKIVCRR